MPTSSLNKTAVTALPASGKNSLTFESVVCSQLELQRRAASFSRRRSTMCRRPSQYLPSTTNSSFSNRTLMPNGISQSTSRTSNAFLPDVSKQFLQMTPSNKRSRASSTNSLGGIALDRLGERQSLVSMLYWEGSGRTTSSKKVGDHVLLSQACLFSIKDTSRTSKWSIDFQKETPQYGSLRSRLIEEYNDCDSLLQFVKKTVLVLMKTSKRSIESADLVSFLIEAATLFLGILLILPIIMMGIGK